MIASLVCLPSNSTDSGRLFSASCGYIHLDCKSPSFSGFWNRWSYRFPSMIIILCLFNRIFRLTMDMVALLIKQLPQTSSATLIIWRSCLVGGRNRSCVHPGISQPPWLQLACIAAPGSSKEPEVSQTCIKDFLPICWDCKSIIEVGREALIHAGSSERSLGLRDAQWQQQGGPGPGIVWATGTWSVVPPTDRDGLQIGQPESVSVL